MNESQWIPLLKESATPVVTIIGVLIATAFQYTKASAHQIRIVNEWIVRSALIAWFLFIIVFSAWGVAKFMLSDHPPERPEILSLVIHYFNLMFWTVFGAYLLGLESGRRSGKSRYQDDYRDK